MAHRTRKNVNTDNTQFRTQHPQKKNNKNHSSGSHHNEYSQNGSRVPSNGTRVPSTSHVPSSTTTIQHSTPNYFDLLDDDNDVPTPQKSSRTNNVPVKTTKKQNVTVSSSSTKVISATTKPSEKIEANNRTDREYGSIFGGLFLEYQSNGDDEWVTEVERYNKLLDEKCEEKHVKPIFSQEHNEPVFVTLNKIEPVIDPALIVLPQRVAFVRAISSSSDDAEVIAIIHNVLEFWSLFNTLATKNLQFLSPTDPAKAKQAGDIFHSLFENATSHTTGTSHTTTNAPRKLVPVKENPKINELRKYNDLHQVFAFIKLDAKIPDDVGTIKIPYIRENGNGKALNDVNINLGSSKMIASKGIHIFNPDSYGGLLPNIISDFVCESMFDMTDSPHIINDKKIIAITFVKTITVKYDSFYNGLRVRILLSNTLEQKIFANAFERVSLHKYISMDNIEYNKLVCNITPKN